MRPRHFTPVATAAAALALLAAALVPSGPATAQGKVVVSGRVVDSAGHPVKGALVVLGDHAMVKMGGGWKVSCVLVPETKKEACRGHVYSGYTNSKGGYHLEIPASTPVLAAQHRALLAYDGQSLFVSSSNRGETKLPAITLWTQLVSAEVNGSQVDLTGQLPTGANRFFSLDLDTRSGKRYPTSWSVDLAKDHTASVDQRVFETAEWGAFGFAGGRWHGRRTGWTGHQSLGLDSGTPASRGADCATYDDEGTLVDIPDCPFTNGDLGDSHANDLIPLGHGFYGSPDCNEGDLCSRDTLVIDLGSIQQPSAVLLRTCYSGCTVDFSLNGSLWSPWQGQSDIGPGHGFSFITGSPQLARFVRIDGLSRMLNSLSEASVWTSAVGASTLLSPVTATSQSRPHLPASVARSWTFTQRGVWKRTSPSR